MEWVRGRDALAAVVIAIAAGGIAVAPPLDALHGWSIDTLTALRWRVGAMTLAVLLFLTLWVHLAVGLFD